VSRDENVVFLMNRFHLSAYVSTIVRQPKLEKEYDEIINILRTMSVHVLILQLDEYEIEQRGSHPERSTAWQKYQKQIAEKEGFRDTLERHIWQQGLIMQAAERQQIPYSVIKLAAAPNIGDEWIRIPESRSIVQRGARVNAVDAKINQGKRRLPETLLEDN
jgi:hypothetical protein